MNREAQHRGQLSDRPFFDVHADRGIDDERRRPDG